MGAPMTDSERITQLQVRVEELEEQNGRYYTGIVRHVATILKCHAVLEGMAKVPCYCGNRHQPLFEGDPAEGEFGKVPREHWCHSCIATAALREET